MCRTGLIFPDRTSPQSLETHRGITHHSPVTSFRQRCFTRFCITFRLSASLWSHLFLYFFSDHPLKATPPICIHRCLSVTPSRRVEQLPKRQMRAWFYNMQAWGRWQWQTCGGDSAAAAGHVQQQQQPKTKRTQQGARTDVLMKRHEVHVWPWLNFLQYKRTTNTKTQQTFRLISVGKARGFTNFRNMMV